MSLRKQVKELEAEVVKLHEVVEAHVQSDIVVSRAIRSKNKLVDYHWRCHKAWKKAALLLKKRHAEELEDIELRGYESSR